MSKVKIKFLSVLAVLFLLSSCSQKIPVITEYELPVPSETTIEDIPVKRVPESRQKFIIIDAGHGGHDFGTEAPLKASFKEKNLNLVTARILQGYLEQMGYRTLLTRNEDVFVSLDKRAMIANNRKADLFVSIHYNSAPSTQAHGIEVFYYRSDAMKVRSQASKALAEHVLKNIIEMTEAKSRGVKHGNLAVIRKTTMPAILIEGGFLTNDKELCKLRDPTYIKTLAWGIASGIQSYLR